MRFDFLDDPDSTMRFIARRLWLKNGWPVAGDFPPGGPQLLAVDADGDPHARGVLGGRRFGKSR